MIDFSHAPGGLYIHIPFCRRKCLYCDFFSGGVSAASLSEFVDALLSELYERRGELPRRLHTIYIGGGTPSILPPTLFTRLVEGVRGIIAEELSDGLDNLEEFTLEVNPEDVSVDNIKAWQKAGVNRVSIGVQSLVDAELKAVGRSHDSEAACRAASLLRDNFQNLSLDLMFGLPGQTLESLEYSLDGVLSFSPDHLSLYSLMYEEGTALTALARSGRIVPVDDSLSLAMYETVASRLAEEGFVQYEISNYCRPGRQSIHNSSYWSFAPYLGIGPSAHSYDGYRRRRANPARIREYIARFNPSLPEAGPGKEPFFSEEILSPAERLEETLMLRLRTREGISIPAFHQTFGDEAVSVLLGEAVRIPSADLRVSDDSVALTRNSVMRSDEIILRLAGALDALDLPENL